MSPKKDYTRITITVSGVIMLRLPKLHPHTQKREKREEKKYEISINMRGPTNLGLYIYENNYYYEWRAKNNE